MKTPTATFASLSEPANVQPFRGEGECGASRVVGEGRAGRVLRAIVQLPRLCALALIAVYQRAISPTLPALFGPGCGCRYYPTCSHYAAEAVREHGALVGSVLAVARVLRCTPFHRGGTDLVPPRGLIRRSCERVIRAAA